MTKPGPLDYGLAAHLARASSILLIWSGILTTQRCQLLVAHLTLINRRELGRSLKVLRVRELLRSVDCRNFWLFPKCIKQFGESFLRKYKGKLGIVEWPSFLWRYWVISISPVGDALPGVRNWCWWPSYTSYILILNLKALNEEPRNLKQYLKSQCNLGGTTKNEVNKKPWKYLSENYWIKRINHCMYFPWYLNTDYKVVKNGFVKY